MRPQVALPSLLIVVLLGALALVGCGSGGGGEDASASQLIQDTFGNDAQLKSGRIGLGLDAELQSGSVQASVDARFAQSEPGKLPKLAGTLKLDSGSGTIQAGAISTGDHGFVTVGGQAYAVPDGDWSSFTKGYLADQKKTDQQRASQPSLSALGIHPQQWLVDPKKAGDSEVNGEKTIHLTADVDVAKMLADVAKVAKKSGASQQIDALGTGIKSASVQIDTGADDHRLRQLQIHLVLNSGSVDLRLTYSDLDQPQTIDAPKDARPLSELTDALSAALGSGAGGSSTTPQSGGNNARYLQCLQQAGQDVAKVQDCARYL